MQTFSLKKYTFENVIWEMFLSSRSQCFKYPIENNELKYLYMFQSQTNHASKMGHDCDVLFRLNWLFTFCKSDDIYLSWKELFRFKVGRGRFPHISVWISAVHRMNYKGSNKVRNGVITRIVTSLFITYVVPRSPNIAGSFHSLQTLYPTTGIQELLVWTLSITINAS